jgi:predicted HicB family RNase H-like nuclease
MGREPEKPFKGSFNVRIAPELHEWIMIVAT